MTSLQTKLSRIPSLKTRQPTGVAPWPLVLVEGAEKSGKSYACAMLSTDERVGRVLYFDLGEYAADQYGALPGADYEVVEHDGSMPDILGQLDACLALPVDPEKPNVIVIDSVSNLWTALKDSAQQTANDRADRKGRKRRNDEEATITPDIWNDIKGANKWRGVITRLQQFRGISVITARGREVADIENGRPTGDSTWKVEAEKSLCYDVDVWVRLTRSGGAQLINARSLVAGVRPGEKPRHLPDFSLARLIFDDLKAGEGTREVVEMSDPDLVPTNDAMKEVMAAVRAAAPSEENEEALKGIARERWEEAALPEPIRRDQLNDLINDIKGAA